MRRTVTSLVSAFTLFTGAVAPAFAERLELEFLPPDFPPTDICRAPAEQVDADETRVGEGGGDEQTDEDIKAWVSYLKRDIRALTRLDANGHLGFIEDLIDLRTEIDPAFESADAAFARIGLYIDAGRIEEIKEEGVIEGLVRMSDDLSQSERVQLGQYFMTGTGVERDALRGEQMLAAEAFKGNANALLAILRLQLSGAELEEWFETPERTAVLAFGGKLGQLNRGLCGRAEFIAEAYLDGDLLKPNAELALAWRKFAADQGGQRAAWRVVEHMLNADVSAYSDDSIIHYLQLAVDDTYAVDANDIDALRDVGATRADRIADVLSRMHGHSNGRTARPAMPFFELDITLDEGLEDTGPHLTYLETITEFNNVPGLIWTRLADEILLRSGRWKGEEKAVEALEKAVEAGDPAAFVKLARMKLRDGHRDGASSMAEQLLLDAVDLHGHAPALVALDGYHRCVGVGTPSSRESKHWSASVKASAARPLSIDVQDYENFSATIAPEVAGLLQSRALRGSTTDTPSFLRRLENDPSVSDEALRYWSQRVSFSKKAIENYAVDAYEVAADPSEAAVAVDFARRVYLANGPSMALDLAVILVEYAGRSPEIADEVRQLLTNAASRGEGAAIRLLHRLSGADDDSIYQQYADVIDQRGDFLALMFAMPFVDDVTFEDYANRAVAEMRCGTKDVAEMADAFAHRGDAERALHWLRVGLSIEGGHSMSRMRIALQKMDMFDTPQLAMVDRTSLGGSLADIQVAYHRVSFLGSDSFNRSAAARILTEALASDDEAVRRWAYGAFNAAEAGIAREMRDMVNIEDVLSSAARSGLSEAQHAYAIHLRAKAQNFEQLANANAWLETAAEAGHGQAMVDLAYGYAHGVGVARDPKLALIWLRRAEAQAVPGAQDLARLVLAMMDAG